MNDSRFPVHLRRGEWNALVIESIVLGALAMAGVIALGRRLAVHVPDAVWFALAVLALGIVLLPVNAVLFRSATHRGSSIRRMVAAAVVGAVAGGMIHFVMQ